MEACDPVCRSIALKYIKLNFFDKLVGRSIEDKIGNFCNITCIRLLNLKNIKRNDRWVFIHVFGVSEFFSSLFSLTNLVINIILYRYLVFPRLKTSELRRILVVQYIVGNTAYFSSTVFHIRETVLTRNTDYFFAYVGILMAALASCSRAMHTYDKFAWCRYEKILTAGSVLFSFFHIYRMCFGVFDKRYNKAVCLLLFVVSSVFDVIVYIHGKKRKYSTYIILYLFSIFAACLVESRDIPPFFFLFDSHATWHLIMNLVSVFYSYYIYHFLEYKFDVSEKEK